MPTRTAALAMLVCLLAAPTVKAEETEARSAPEAFFLKGDERHNPGEPSGAKLATVVSLYALSAASLAVGTIFGVRALSQGDDADEHRAAQPRGFCDDPTAEACASYDELRSSQNTSARNAGIFTGLGALLFVGGAATAQLWQNETTSTRVSLSPAIGVGRASLSLRGSF